MLTVPQQARAALSHVRRQLQESGMADALTDNAFSDRLDNNFVTLYGLFVGAKFRLALLRDLIRC